MVESTADSEQAVWSRPPQVNYEWYQCVLFSYQRKPITVPDCGFEFSDCSDSAIVVVIYLYVFGLFLMW